MPKYKFLSCALVTGVALAALLTTSVVHSAKPANLLRSFERVQAILTARNACLLFDLYLAQTSEQRSQGLMYVESMERYEGMLFVYQQPAEISMWMKNTLLSLDMLFLNQQRISHIHANAVPLSTDIISSKGIVSGVIELNGGAAETFGIRSGDSLLAAWQETTN